ncbi:hypothetical protein KUH03_31680 [Sphingobacterium sp. E70]|uniref:hypothetical protein n=1 Tax=Sphingobacterium sp. E70 TaxID=2853439 RepID=UPI00211BE733|nr:hypothetical protein [Sphingobacterium sp. E70]ULT23683.1 hypothetical protein KUH03_31680 [Sphingobacterium sp. E70]
MGQLDSLQKYIELQLSVLRDFNEESAATMFLGAYDDLGQLYIKKGDFVKAQQYLDRSLTLVDKYKIPCIIIHLLTWRIWKKRKAIIKKLWLFIRRV